MSFWYPVTSLSATNDWLFVSVAHDEQKLLTLKEKKAGELVKSGEAGWIYAHLITLSNMSKLVDRISKRK